MINKKITDEEIKSSLEVIATTRNCNECKIRNCKWGTCNCSQITANVALDLINRKQAEIEELRIENQSLRAAASSYKLHYDEASAEAIKEFAERLKNSIYINTNLLVYQCEEVKSVIDDIVKEMVGDTE